MTEEDVMDRRTALRGFLGAAALASGGTLLLPRQAQALPGASALPDLNVTPAPAVATESDIAAAQVENVQAVCWRNRWGQLVCRRRPRYVYVRPYRPWGYGRRCWINRWGQRVCRW
jgi:hypothetical protein